MSDPRFFLIALRFGLGFGLICTAGIFAILYCNTNCDVIRLGAAISAVATFGCGIHFCGQALDMKLWEPLWPSARDWDEPDKTAIK